VKLRPLRVLDAVRRADYSDPAEKDILDAAIRLLDPQVEQADALRVIDLRGAKRPSAELLKVISVEGARVDEDHPLLILGDDRALDECKWLELDRRETAVIKPAGAAWLPDDALPPSRIARIRAMIAITDFGVPLEDLPTEKPS
jgi:hypothetical protein